MNILYIAYSCKPYKGSEEKIGWSVPLESAKNNNVFVITKEEHREAVTEYLHSHNVKNIRFFFVDINGIYKKLCKGFLYSARLNVWQKKAFALAREICKNEKIDVIHQITPVEFRSIGRYADIPEVKFVCGPIGGGEYLPKALNPYAKGNRAVEFTRRVVNSCFKLKYRLNKRLSKCDYLLFCNKETKDYISPLISDVPCELYSEVGIDKSEIVTADSRKDADSVFTMLVAGRIIYRKGHSFLLDVLSSLPEDLHYVCKVVGEGPDLNALKEKCKRLGLADKVQFTGRIPFEQMEQCYASADALVMPSLRETTGSVLLEAVSQGLVLITMNRFGGEVLLKDSPMYFYDGESLDEITKSFADAICECADSADRKQRAQHLNKIASDNTWDKKMEHYSEIYRQVCEE